MKPIKYILTLVVTLTFISCTKEVPKELLNNNKQMPNNQTQNQQMPNDSIHKNLRNQTGETTSSDEEIGDKKADEMVKVADDADTKYQKSKSEADKTACIQKQLAAANYLMFEANLSPKNKYRPALKRYNRVLELDPGNVEAKENKVQIEDIYKSMGMPVPN